MKMPTCVPFLFFFFFFFYLEAKQTYLNRRSPQIKESNLSEKCSSFSEMCSGMSLYSLSSLSLQLKISGFMTT